MNVSYVNLPIAADLWSGIEGASKHPFQFLWVFFHLANFCILASSLLRPPAVTRKPISLHHHRGSSNPLNVPLRRGERRLLEEIRPRSQRCIRCRSFLPDSNTPLIEYVYWLVSWSDGTVNNQAVVIIQQIRKTTCGTGMTALKAAFHIYS